MPLREHLVTTGVGDVSQKVKRHAQKTYTLSTFCVTPLNDEAALVAYVPILLHRNISPMSSFCSAPVRMRSGESHVSPTSVFINDRVSATPHRCWRCCSLLSMKNDCFAAGPPHSHLRTASRRRRPASRPPDCGFVVHELRKEESSRRYNRLRYRSLGEEVNLSSRHAMHSSLHGILINLCQA